MTNATTGRGLAVAALVVVCMFALAGTLFVAPGGEALQRLGLLFGLLGTTVATLTAAIRADQTNSRLNGGLDARLQDAAHRAVLAVRRGEPEPPPLPLPEEPKLS